MDARAMERNQRKEMDMLASELIPVRPKSMTKAPSLTPNPERETGITITVMITGTKTKRAAKDGFCPIPKDMTYTMKMPISWMSTESRKAFIITVFFLKYL